MKTVFHRVLVVLTAITLALPMNTSSFAQDQAPPASEEAVAFSRLSALVLGAADRDGISEDDKAKLEADIAAIQEIYKKPERNEADKKTLRELLSRVTPHITSLVAAYKADTFTIGQGEIEGFTQAELEKIRSVCGGALEAVLKAVQSQDQGASFAEENGARAEECRLLVLNATEILNKQLAALSKAEQDIVTEINELERQYQVAETPEKKQEIRSKIQEKEAELKETREKKKRVEEVKGKVDWGKILAGVALFVAGVVVAVYGDPNTGVAMMTAGGKLAEEGGNPKTDKREVVDETVKKQREGLETGKPHDTAKAAPILDEYKAAGYEVLSASNAGNFMVFRDPSDKAWIVLQIDPRSQVERIAPAIATVQPSGPPLKGLEELTEIQVRTLDLANGVSLTFGAKLNGAPVSGGLVEQGVGSKNYSLTLDAEYKAEK
ncbi:MULTISPECIES: hypothetical protein [unclassified Mesorhizobium]|uniref:hypothetical protein n=1 Tax=unclassified Mesorhizobium TaxID=325217 RepID=UPI00333D4350